ncbi:MAG: hypothetical protein AAFO03_08550 [Bacteroidota bacterium]
MYSLHFSAQHKAFLLLFSTLLFCLCACNKPEDDGIMLPGDGELETGSGITATELNEYPGDLGLLIDTRNIAKKGHYPTQVVLDFAASEGDYDREVPVDPYTNIATVSIPVSSLSAEAAAELRDGVPLDYRIEAAGGELLEEGSISIIPLRENGTKITATAADLPYADETFVMTEGMPYFLQTVDASGNFSDQVVEKSANAEGNVTQLYEDYSAFRNSWSNHQYYFQAHPGEDNVYSIYSRHTNRYLGIDYNWAGTFYQSGSLSYPIDPSALSSDFKFRIQRAENGFFTLHDANGDPLRRFEESGQKAFWRTTSTNPVQYFRIIALDVEWEVTELSTEHQAPIYPPAETTFGFNSTLINCGNGSLEQEVGIEESVTSTYTVGFEETIGLSSRATTSLEATVGATAEASFFGSGGSVSAEVSAGLELSVEATQTSTISSENSTSKENTFFSKRTVTVPAGSASLVYDAYQTYSNVQIPFVKRFRVRANQIDPVNNAVIVPMTGAAINTQFSFVGFKGVVTTVGPDYIEITVRGTTRMDNIVQAQSEVRDVPADCN